MASFPAKFCNLLLKNTSLMVYACSFYCLQLLLNKITSEQKVSPFCCQTTTFYLMHIAKFGAKLSKNRMREEAFRKNIFNWLQV